MKYLGLKKYFLCFQNNALELSNTNFKKLSTDMECLLDFQKLIINKTFETAEIQNNPTFPFLSLF